MSGSKPTQNTFLELAGIVWAELRRLQKARGLWRCWLRALRGAAYQLIRGNLVAEEIELDGKIVIDAKLDGCTVNVRSANFMLINPSFTRCLFRFYGDAARLRDLVLLIEHRRGTPPDVSRTEFGNRIRFTPPQITSIAASRAPRKRNCACSL